MTDDRPQTYCSVEVAAHLAGLSVTRVRRLVRTGLIQPPIVERGRPLFGEVELARLRKIRRLTTDLGVNLAGVEIIVNMRRKIETMQQEMERFIAHVREELGRRKQEEAIESSRALVKVPGHGHNVKSEKR